ncbi:MAG: hypothetical protein R3A46_06685 [Thermomicrobiales bacterium]
MVKSGKLTTSEKPVPAGAGSDQRSVDLKRPLDDAASRRGAGFRLTAEGLAYLTIAVLAVLTRFWDLGSRAMNHDESLHTYYSWLYFDNYHYVHDPLMHGPALFHLNALAYFLFGDNDVTARIMPAIFGAIVLMPALLHQAETLGALGRDSSLGDPPLLAVDSLLLALHPSRRLHAILRRSRSSSPALKRYLDKPERRWIIVAAISTFFLFTTKGKWFIVAFIVVTFLAVVVTWQIHRAMFGVLVGSVIALGVVLLGLRSMGVEPLPGIPWEDPSDRNISAFATDFAPSIHTFWLRSESSDSRSSRR